MSNANNEVEFWKDMALSAQRDALEQQAEATALLGLIAEIVQRSPEYERGIIAASLEDRIAAAREKVALDLDEKFRRATGNAPRPDRL